MNLPPLIEGRLLRRYKRFLADVELGDGRRVTAHTPNTGSMRQCCTPGSRVWLSDSGNPRRKYPLTWEIVEASPGVRVGIHTGLANDLAVEAIAEGRIEALSGHAGLRREVRYGSENSRIDILLEDPGRGRCFVEVKNVTLVEGGTALFPDAVTARGSKHLRELQRVAAGGDRAVVLFCVQRGDCERFAPAEHIDPAYAAALGQALAGGVEVLAWQAAVELHAIRLSRELPLAWRPAQLPD